MYIIIMSSNNNVVHNLHFYTQKKDTLKEKKENEIMLHTKYTRLVQIKEIFGSIMVTMFGVGGLMLMFIISG